MEINIVEFLTSLRGERISYIPNPGNGGDALIASGTYQAFDSVGLDYAIVSRDRDSYAGEFVIYSGGGNLGLMKNFSARFLSRIHKNVKRLVILPHTIKAVTPLLQEFGPNVDIICRERVSYEYVKGAVEKANVYLADDMALQLDVAALLDMRPTFIEKCGVAADYARYKLLRLGDGQPPSLFAVKRLFEAERLTAGMREIATGPILHAYRTDSEKTNMPLPPDNVDVSEVLTMGIETKQLAYLNSHYFLSFLNRFERIRTNRLHVSIGAALMGKPVEFHGNSYYKCRAVYEYSLTGYSNLQFVEDAA